MPTKASKKNPTRKTREAENKLQRTKGKSKWLIWTIWGFLFALVIVVYLVLTGVTDEKTRMVTYLKDKYGEAFVVSDAVYKNSGFGVKGVWEARAYPVANPDLKFKVSAYKEDYSDQYIAAIWTHESMPEFKKNVSSTFGDEKIDASLHIVLSGHLADSATKTSPSLKEARAMDDGFLYQVKLVRNQGEESKITEDASRAATLLQLINESGVNRRGLSYEIHTDSGVIRYCEISSGDSELTAATIEKCIRERRI